MTELTLPISVGLSGIIIFLVILLIKYRFKYLNALRIMDNTDLPFKIAVTLSGIILVFCILSSVTTWYYM